MPQEIIKPQLHPDKWQEIEKYLLQHWTRATEARRTQVDEKQQAWDKNYRAVPREKERSFPWPKSSNFVVPLSRMFIDTSQARTLNLVFATKPIYVMEGMPTDIREALEEYFNRKAVVDWNHYKLASRLLIRGPKNGTSVVKTFWEEDREIEVLPSQTEGAYDEQDIDVFIGPSSELIPFEDFCVYPITAQDMTKVLIKFHRLRFPWESAVERNEQGWRMLKQSTEDGSWSLVDISAEELEQWMQSPQDISRQSAGEDQGVVDPELKELHAVECHFRYPLDNYRRYRLIATICPHASKLIDLYFDPTPPKCQTFNEFVPFEVEDLFYGESMCQILGQAQEETSQIHNDRRNNSMLANTVTFKRKNGAAIPNPSTTYYPGIVWDLENMDDLELMVVGRNYTDTLAEENQTIELAQMLSGIGPPMMGNSTGSMGKRGVYNTQGVLGVMAEGNQRQDTYIRDFRGVMSHIMKTSVIMQSRFQPDDPIIATFHPDKQNRIRQGLQMIQQSYMQGIRLDIKVSNAGANSEIRKGNLVQMAQVLGQYGNTTLQLAGTLANPELNPVLKQVMMEIVKMHRWMAARLLHAFEEPDGEEVIPDVINALATGGAGGAQELASTGQGNAGPSLVQGGAGPAGVDAAKSGLQAILTQLGAANGGGQGLGY